jgi:hypothetical protein
MKTNHSLLYSFLLLNCTIGCDPANGQTISYFTDIQPIVRATCTGCHRSNGMAPFPLMTYDDLAKRGNSIASVTQKKYMPPWRADTAYSSFSNQCVLTNDQIRIIGSWVNSGMKKGRVAKTDIQKEQHAALIDHPADLELSLNKPFKVAGDNADAFMVFKIPFELSTPENVEAIEFFCNNHKIVHHANFGFWLVNEQADLYRGDDRVDLLNNSAAYFQFDTLAKKQVYYTGWIPGTTYESYPPGMGWTLPKKGVMLLYIHFAPIGANENFKGGVKLFFTRQKIEREIRIINIGTGGVGDIDPPLFIRAGAVSSFTASVATRQDQSILYVWPHMHLLGNSFKAYAVSPAGDTIHLVSIPKWDFNWQWLYRFRKLVHIPAGSVIYVKANYDNTSNNPLNPNDPPKAVFSDSRGIMQTKDEMLNLLMIYVNYLPGDEDIPIE